MSGQKTEPDYPLDIRNFRGLYVPCDLVAAPDRHPEVSGFALEGLSPGSLVTPIAGI